MARQTRGIAAPAPESATGRIHFLHVGKTAGSTVVELLRRHRASDRVQVHGHEVTLREVPAGESCVFFIRDPVARYVSAFNSRRREGRPTYHFPHDPEEADAFRRFRTPNELAEALDSLRRRRREAARRAFRAIRHLRRDYVHYLVSPAYLDARSDSIPFVGRQEAFAASWRVLRGLLGIAAAEGAAAPRAGPLPRIHAAPAGEPTALSRRARANLQVRLAPDIAIHRHLVRGAAWRSRLPPDDEKNQKRF